MERAEKKSQTIHELALEGDFEVTSFVRNVEMTINFSHPHTQCRGSRIQDPVLFLHFGELNNNFLGKNTLFLLKWLKLVLYLYKK
jgi:hypothetical protein